MSEHHEEPCMCVHLSLAKELVEGGCSTEDGMGVPHCFYCWSFLADSSPSHAEDCFFIALKDFVSKHD